MDESDSTYAPRSPDLSALQKTSFAPEPTSSFYPPQQHPYQNSYAPNSVYTSTALNHPNPYASHFPPQHQAVNSYLPPTTMPARKASKHHLEDGDDAFNPESIKRGPGRKPKKEKFREKCDKLAPGVAEGIEVKTKFPVARIKRIMQADEDVGKVAQTTPTAVSKALELFMISVVTKAAAEGKAKGTKRVTAAHIKQAFEKDEQLDFLATIMQKVPDGPQPKKDEDSEEGGDGRKKKGVTRKRKKNTDG